MRQGHRASIAEEERPGVFSLRVGNLMPGDVATVQLTMVGVLPYRDGEVTFRFPLVVAPRYIPACLCSGPSVGDGTAVDTNDVPDASRISPPVLLPGLSQSGAPVADDRPVRGGRGGRRLARQPVHGVWGRARGDAPADPAAGRAAGSGFHPAVPARRRSRADVAVASSRRWRRCRGDLSPLTIVPPVSSAGELRSAAAPRRRALARPLRQHGRLEDGGGPSGDGPHDRHAGRRRPVRRLRF